MTRIRVFNYAISLDGYVAGPDQSLEAPMGVGGMALHEWALRTRTGRQMMGENGGVTGVDDDFMAAGFDGIGATLMGRNMFGPIRGDWGDESWQGWWGDTPPFHHEVFVLTHQPRTPLEMNGGTTFHFVTDGFESGLDQAREAAGGLDVRVGGGASVVRQCLRAGVLDELHLALVPIVLGAGERLFDGVGELPGYECTQMVATEAATHIVLTARR